mgnify:CR=1 FL=1
MDIALSEEQRLLREGVRRLLDARYDAQSRAARAAAPPDSFDHALWQEFAELGWLSLAVPEALGGSGLGAVETVLVMEGFGRALAVEPYLPTAVLGVGLLLRAGTEGQQRDVLPRVADGSARLAFAYAEPQARYDVFDVATEGQACADGWVLRGHKSVVLGAPAADYLIVSARVTGDRRDPSRLALFLLPRGAPGLTLRPYRLVDGQIAAEVVLDGVAVGADALMATGEPASAAIEDAIDQAAVAVAAEAVGAMERAIEITREHLRTRVQFGRPLAAFQVLRHRLVDMFIATEEARSLVHRAAALLDDAAAGPAQRRRAVSAAKVQAGEAGRVVGEGAVQLHGAIGVADEHAIGQHLKRLIAADRLFGDADHHLGRFAALGTER